MLKHGGFITLEITKINHQYMQDGSAAKLREKLMIWTTCNVAEGNKSLEEIIVSHALASTYHATKLVITPQP
jgi:hypothetical protein